MRHAREDYNRIQDPENKIPDDEPVFLIRGQDVLGPMVLEFYAQLAQTHNVDPRIVKGTFEQAEKMKRWQVNVTSKFPDMP